jgi:hypothetical protein
VRTHGGRETCLVRLHLVGVDDLADEAQCEVDGEAGLAGACGS